MTKAKFLPMWDQFSSSFGKNADIGFRNHLGGQVSLLEGGRKDILLCDIQYDRKDKDCAESTRPGCVSLKLCVLRGAVIWWLDGPG